MTKGMGSPRMAVLPSIHAVSSATTMVNAIMHVKMMSSDSV